MIELGQCEICNNKANGTIGFLNYPSISQAVCEECYKNVLKMRPLVESKFPTKEQEAQAYKNISLLHDKVKRFIYDYQIKSDNDDIIYNNNVSEFLSDICGLVGYYKED